MVRALPILYITAEPEKLRFDMMLLTTPIIRGLYTSHLRSKPQSTMPTAALLRLGDRTVLSSGIYERPSLDLF